MHDRRLTLPLTSERLIVRDLTMDDLAAMHGYAANEAVARYLFWGPNTLPETEASLKSFVAAQEDSPRMVYELGMVLRHNDQLVGALCLYLGDREQRNDAEIGFVMEPEHWGQGYVSEAADALMRAGFDDLGLHRIWATCDARNTASIRVLEKIGMRHEARFQARRKSDDIWVDELSYAVLASELS